MRSRPGPPPTDDAASDDCRPPARGGRGSHDPDALDADDLEVGGERDAVAASGSASTSASVSRSRRRRRRGRAGRRRRRTRRAAPPARRGSPPPTRGSRRRCDRRSGSRTTPRWWCPARTRRSRDTPAGRSGPVAARAAGGTGRAAGTACRRAWQERRRSRRRRRASGWPGRRAVDCRARRMCVQRFGGRVGLRLLPPRRVGGTSSPTKSGTYTSDGAIAGVSSSPEHPTASANANATATAPHAHAAFPRDRDVV